MLNWPAHIQNPQPTGHGVIILSLVAASGLALGSIRVRGLSLGIAGTLFAGPIFAHFGFNLEPSFRSFIQESPRPKSWRACLPKTSKPLRTSAEECQAGPQPH